jgi:hypothetical protein
MNKKNLKVINSKNSVIFTKKINTDYKLIPFTISVNDTGLARYSPPVSKEWINSVYNYNANEIKNYPVYDININSLVRGYFSLYFNHTFLKSKYISRKSKRQSLNKIFVSKAEVKHTNNKAIITLYVYNRERLVLLNKIKKIQNLFDKFNILNKKLSKFVVNLLCRVLSLKKNKINNKSIKTSYIILLLKHKLNSQLKYFNKTYFNENQRFLKRVKKVFTTIRRLRLKLSLNQYKFEEKFLYKLSGMISRYYGKKVEFNIVNLKSIVYNSDIFTEIFGLKVKTERSNPLQRMNLMLTKVHLAKNTTLKKGRLLKSVDYKQVENKYKNLNLNSILSNSDTTELNYNDNLSKLLYNLYYKTSTKDLPKSNDNLNKEYYNKLREIIFENVKYKNIGGVRLEVKGRLTKRYRADRAIYKLKWKGGLKNIDSSYKGLSIPVLRGYLDSNLEKSMMASKRKIGSFAVKGWFAAK